MYQNIGQGNLLGLGNVGNFANNYYWSSTESGSGMITEAWGQLFDGGEQESLPKNFDLRVRAVRAF